MELSRRLRMNASFVTPGNRLADVGTDHGYIPIALRLEGVIPSALAMDIIRDRSSVQKSIYDNLIWKQIYRPASPMVYRLCAPGRRILS